MIEKLYQHFLNAKGVSTDTRKIEKGHIFFALKGPNFNANKFAAEALDKGADYVVIDDKDFQIDDRCLLVDDALSTLQQLAIHHRKQLTIPVIGLTGSNGKTTTKELIYTALATKYNVLATKGNLNNHIGVPLTILSITSDHEMAIIEMGANHVGEIAALCNIASPSHGLITNIGKAHLEGFGGFEGVIRGKSELYQHLISTNGVVWINSQNEILSNMGKRFKNPYYYPAKGDFYHCEMLEASPFVIVKTETGTTFTSHLIGQYNFENIATALCIAKFFEVDEQAATQAVANYNPDNNRSQLVKKGSNTILLDAYNANPNSMNSALDNLQSMQATNKVVILGDMKELGETSQAEHRQICEKLGSLNFKQVFLFGPEFSVCKEALPTAFHTTDKKQLIEKIKATSLSDSLVLIKGSRSMALEEVVDVI